VQTQYESIGGEHTANVGQTALTKIVDTNTTFMRRLYLGFRADIGEGISAEIVNNFADNTLDKALFTAETAYGNFVLGYQKVQWGLEENTSSSKLLTVERSAANRYWAESATKIGRLGFGARHTGLHYSNKYAVDSAQTIDYGFAVVNAMQGQDAKKNNDIGTYANVVYTNKITDTNKHSIGLNWGSIKNPIDATGTAPAAGLNDAQIFGVNPYIKSQFGNLTVQAEMISTTNDAVTGASASGQDVKRKPEGYTAIVAYKFSDQIEGVVRYSQLDTDGAGAQFGELYRDASANSQYGGYYNKFDSYYVGVNYYFVDHNAKIMLGYENANASERLGTTAAVSGASTPGGKVGTGKASADIFRLQAQVLF
jgi:phosphate-selective porin